MLLLRLWLVLMAVIGACVFAAPPRAKKDLAVKITLPQTLPDHPRLLIRKASLPQIRERAEKADWGKAALKAIRRSADQWVAREIALPDRGGQWFHWYACKKDGANLKTESPTRHVCPLCGEVYSGYPYDDVILMRDHHALARATLDCGLMFQIAGDNRYATKAKEILLAYARKYQSYRLHTIRGEERVGGGRVGPQTLDEAMWLIPMAQGADLVWSALTEAERAELGKGLFRPAAEVIRSHRIGIHNIQCWKNAAVGLVGFLLGEKELIHDAINDPDRGYRAQMEQGISPDGVWYEGAWGYHFFTMLALWPLTEAAWNCGMNLYGPEFKRLFEGPLALAMPNGHLPAFNDSGEVNIHDNAWLYEIALARYGDPQFATMLATSRRDSMQSVVLGKLELPKPASGAANSRNFPQSGYAILSHGDGEKATWLALKYGPHGGGHGHPDKLNFVLYARGQIVAPDPGTAKYGVPIQKEWFRTTLAHNTLVGGEQSQREAEGRCLVFVAGQRVSAVAADAGPIYPDLAFCRTVALFGDDVLLFIDRISSRLEYTLDLAYHNRGTFAKPPAGDAWTPRDTAGYMHFRDTVVAARKGQFSAGFALDHGLATRFTALLPDGAQAIAGTGVGRNTRDRVPMIVLRGKAKELIVGWAVTIGEGLAPAPELRLKSDRAVALEAVLDNRTCMLVSNPDQQGVRVGDKSYNAPIICAEQMKGRLTIEQGRR